MSKRNVGRRERSRAETKAAILAAARAEIAEKGGVGLSMRAVAREVGLVSSAVYRYFETREALLTAMIIESYGNLAAELVAVEDDLRSAQQWRSLAGAMRRWARDHPHEFQLVYGTPIPGYVAPSETVPAAEEVAAPFLACLGEHPVKMFDAAVTEDLVQLAEMRGVAPSAAAAVIAELASLAGFVGLELAEHFAGTAEPAEALFEAMVGRQVATLGLAEN